jgi:hypothetical protein
MEGQKGLCVWVLFAAAVALLFVQGGEREKKHTAYKMSWMGCMGSGARSVGHRQVLFLKVFYWEGGF